MWSEEYDCIPLGLRSKLLHSNPNPSRSRNRNRNRNDCCDSTANAPCGRLSGNSKEKQTIECSSTAIYSELSIQQALDNVSSAHSLDFDSSSVIRPSEVGTGIEQVSSCVLGNGLMGPTSSSANVQANGLKHEFCYDFDESLDNIKLGERRKMLLSRKLMESSRLDTVDSNNREISNSFRVMLHNSENETIRDTLIPKHVNEINESYNLALGNATDKTSQTANKCSEPMPVSSEVPTNSSSLLLSEEGKSCGTKEPHITNNPAVASSVLPLVVEVKNEPLDSDEFCSEGKNIMQNSLISPILSVKNEPGISEYTMDEVDHMPLAKRLNLLSSGIPSLDMSGTPEISKEDVASGLDFGNEVLESVKPINISRPRKKRRTATDSVETALEEDAPGLLKVLLDRGVSAEEIKLYGEEDGDDALDDSFSEDGFAELEAVISQLFSQRQSFLKFPLLRTKGVKVNYCLSCLLSLVEQTKYLRSRKWHVEWGWCRDLQSFIFVFKRHNRIVLERPEYGYATYFFELLNSVPVAWQIKRLVTAMKLTSCGRITVIENKPLLVGEDLSEGEAKVLAEFGWTPNTGLGTMLNYCDRVVHDRKQEFDDSSEWRMKIGKQLMNGYNGGNLVADNLPKRLIECREVQNVQVKVEEE